jgi:hypothetical protein
MENETENRYIPQDYKEFEKYGTCGESCIVVLTKAPSVEGQANYQQQQYGHLWTNVGEMEEMLKQLHFETKRRRGNKVKKLPTLLTSRALVFIQWLNDEGEEYYWREAQTHTHWILMQNEKDGIWIWDNAFGWLKKEEWEKKGGIDNGYIRSYLEVSPFTPYPKGQGFSGAI